jgi:hypothetical protein
VPQWRLSLWFEGWPGQRGGATWHKKCLNLGLDEPDVSFFTPPEGEPAHSPEELAALRDRFGFLSLAFPFAGHHASTSEQSKNEYRSSSVGLSIRDDHAGSCLLGPRGVRSAGRNAKQSIAERERLRLSRLPEAGKNRERALLNRPERKLLSWLKSGVLKVNEIKPTVVTSTDERFVFSKNKASE